MPRQRKPTAGALAARRNKSICSPEDHDDDRRHAGMVRAADGDPSSADRPDDAVDPGACRQEPGWLDDGGRP